ncbi:hypothetical protein [Fibrella forsythiae]|uniref:Lipoprotein n=1 Tax=Fibrella forsythiae TaxID=2817061 RepID=A0ABS3JRA7_9BACT|nr:hypothetical protein [Fibrella forsythiae]MBO0951734.1 hypothetical protein [Fibrella forsythiae]
MKSISTLLIGLGLLACSAPTRAQDDSKLRKDPTYSTHNYKHPNKAVTARNWESKEGVTVQTPSMQDSRLANYKTQVPGQPPVGGVTVPHTLNEELANRNYKMQKPSINASQDSTIARKRAKKRADDATIGD